LASSSSSVFWTIRGRPRSRLPAQRHRGISTSSIRRSLDGHRTQPALVHRGQALVQGHDALSTNCYVAGVPTRRLALLVVASTFVAGCSSPPTSAHSTQPPGSSQVSVATTSVIAEPSTSLPGPACSSGTVNVGEQPSEAVTPVCITVGSILILTGGYGGSGGSWPGPPTISNGRVLALTSSGAHGMVFKADLRGIGVGSATVEVPFVAGPDVCNPTPCTPVPGRPLDWKVTVIG
jgi:hypothetical protein